MVRGVRESVFEEAASLRIMGEALLRHVHVHGLRTAAREVGVSPTGLAGIVAGRSRPHPATLRKLRRWYVRERRRVIRVTRDSRGRAHDGRA